MTITIRRRQGFKTVHSIDSEKLGELVDDLARLAAREDHRAECSRRSRHESRRSLRPVLHRAAE